MKCIKVLLTIYGLASLPINCNFNKSQNKLVTSKLVANNLKKLENTEKIISEQYTIKLEPRWDDLDKNNKAELFKEKWILAADIIIKKTAPEYVSLNELHLCWHGKNGKKINQLIASLYEKNSDKDFMPIEQYLICDSTWKKSEQKLILKFVKPKMLFTSNKLSLVLTIPKDLITTVKSGHFTLDNDYLPAEYKDYASQHDLCLYLGNK